MFSHQPSLKLRFQQAVISTSKHFLVCSHIFIISSSSFSIKVMGSRSYEHNCDLPLNERPPCFSSLVCKTNNNYFYTVSGKKVTPCVLFYNSGKWCRINKILHQQCSIELQTNCKISVKSVNNYKSYSGFSAGTQKLKCPL